MQNNVNNTEKRHDGEKQSLFDFLVMFKNHKKSLTKCTFETRKKGQAIFKRTTNGL